MIANWCGKLVWILCSCFLISLLIIFFFSGTKANEAAGKSVKETIGQKIEVYLQVKYFKFKCTILWFFSNNFFFYRLLIFWKKNIQEKRSLIRRSWNLQIDQFHPMHGLILLQKNSIDLSSKLLLMIVRYFKLNCFFNLFYFFNIFHLDIWRFCSFECQISCQLAGPRMEIKTVIFDCSSKCTSCGRASMNF